MGFFQENRPKSLLLRGPESNRGLKVMSLARYLFSTPRYSMSERCGLYNTIHSYAIKGVLDFFWLPYYYSRVLTNIYLCCRPITVSA